jgi:hypothetical protein
MKSCRNYKIFGGLYCKKLETVPMVAGGYNFSNSCRSRAREVARSGANERGRRGDSIPYITYRRNASWWSNLAGEEAAAGLFMAAALISVVAACRAPGAVQEETQGAAKGEEQAQELQGLGLAVVLWWRARAGERAHPMVASGPARPVLGGGGVAGGGLVAVLVAHSGGSAAGLGAGGGRAGCRGSASGGARTRPAAVLLMKADMQEGGGRCWAGTACRGEVGRGEGGAKGKARRGAWQG